MVIPEVEDFKIGPLRGFEVGAADWSDVVSIQVDELQVGPIPLPEELAALISDGVAPEGYPFELWPICPDEFLTAARTDVVEFQMNAGEVLQPIYHFQEEAAFISNVVIIQIEFPDIF